MVIQMNNQNNNNFLLKTIIHQDFLLKSLIQGYWEIF